jgi:predicted DNA-binding transcriptional regulator AlpA
MSTSSTHDFGWPRLLKLALAAQYAGMSEDTFLRICPVPPKDMGFRGLRWDRAKLDKWIDCLPDRVEAQDAEVLANPVPADADERRRACLERMR